MLDERRWACTERQVFREYGQGTESQLPIALCFPLTIEPKDVGVAGKPLQGNQCWIHALLLL